MEGGGLDPLLDRPAHRPLEHERVVLVHPEHEAAVDHDPQAVQTADDLRLVTVQVLELALGTKGVGVEGLEADEQAAQAAGHGLFQ